MTAEQIAAGLTKAQRAAWSRTVLVIVHSEQQRRAFIAGYNGRELPNNSSPQMRENYALGIEVRRILQETPDAQ